MAIGDAFAVVLGTATTNRQPASGVFEQISAIAKDGTTDAAFYYDGSNELTILNAAVSPQQVQGSAAATRLTTMNTALLIGNDTYYRKGGTTDRHVISGVQVDA